MPQPPTFRYASVVFPHLPGRDFHLGVMEKAGTGSRHIHPMDAGFVANGNILDRQNWVQGAIAFVSVQQLLRKLRKFPAPVINTSGNLEQVPFPSVLNDEAELGRVAASHLIASGAPRILHLTCDPDYPRGFRGLRHKGVQEVCQQAGIPDLHLAVTFVPEPDILHRVRDQTNQIKEVLQSTKLPFSIVAADSLTGNLANQAIQACGWQAGREVGLFQITDPRENLRWGNPEISFVSQNWKQVGALAAESLFQWVEQGKEPPAMQRVPPLPPELTQTSDASAGQDIVTRIQSFLLHCKDYGITAEEIAANAGVSLRTINRHFLAQRGLTLKQALMNRKLDYGKELLRKTGLPVADIAARCGYGAAQTFSSAFRKETGLTPAAYRSSRTS